MNRTQAVRPDSRAIAAIRPVRPADQAALVDFFAGLSAQTCYLRFFGPLTLTPALLHLLSGGAANAVVAVRGGVIVGHAMAADRTDPKDPEGARMTDIGVVVADAWQGRGLGSALVRALVAGAKARGVTCFPGMRLGPDPAPAGPAATAPGKSRPPGRSGRGSPPGR